MVSRTLYDRTLFDLFLTLNVHYLFLISGFYSTSEKSLSLSPEVVVLLLPVSVSEHFVDEGSFRE